MKKSEETLGDRMREFGNQHYENLTEFARALGVVQPVVSRYINNKSDPGSALLLRLEHLGCSIDWLLTGKKVVVNIINSYPVRKNLNMDSEEIIEEVLFPFHKKEGMYCIYVNKEDIIQNEKKNIFTILLIDQERALKEDCEVVVRDNKGNDYYKRVQNHNSIHKVLMPVNVSGNPRVIDDNEIEVIHRVVSRHTSLT